MKSQNKPQNKTNYFDQEEANLDYAHYQEVDDPQYKAMMPDKKGKLDSLSYFKKSQKYTGKVFNPQQMLNEQELSEQEFNQNDGIKTALKNIKNKRKEKSKLLEEDLKAIDEEDKLQMKRMKDASKEQGDPEALQNQLFEYNKLIQMRYHAQKNLEDLKRYPVNNFPVSQKLHTLQKQSQKSVLSNINLIVQNYEKLAIDFFSKSTSIDLKINTFEHVLQTDSHSLNSKKLNVEKLWEKFQEETKDLNERMEEQIINWSQRTTLLRNSTSKSQYNSLLMQTPIGQAKKAIEDWDKVSKKCQQKRAPIKILFEGQQNLRENTNVNIYDDIDLLQQVQKNYEEQLEKDDKDFLIKDTLKYIENKNKIKISKDVDRKASKNRKIRFNVHTKLLNFLPSESENLLEAREEIVKNLFNKGTHYEQAVDYIDI